MRNPPDQPSAPAGRRGAGDTAGPGASSSPPVRQPAKPQTAQTAQQQATEQHRAGTASQPQSAQMSAPRSVQPSVRQPSEAPPTLVTPQTTGAHSESAQPTAALNGHAAPPWSDAPSRTAPAALRTMSKLLSATTRDRLHNALIDAPVAGEAYVRMRSQLRHGIVTPKTELVLEGYPRSANAYAEWAFRYANGEDLRIAVRLHSPRAVRFGVEHGIPTIVLLRPPRDAVASWLQYKPGLKAERAFRRYALYYEQVYPLREGVVVAEFDDVVADFGAVIERCNARFGTSFEPYPGDAAAEAWVRARIESAWSYDETGEAPEHRVPRPSNDRSDAGELLEGLMNDPRVAKALNAAERVWERMSDRAA